MCGIFFANGVNAGQKVLAGLQRLEYRGYDSWGIAVWNAANESIEVEKHVGQIGQVKTLHLPETTIAIGHTRWATHGGVTELNAHPHAASDGSFVLAQNGVVQNFAELKTELLSRGHHFISETDTEVIVRLIEEKRKTVADFRSAVRAGFADLIGRNTIIILTKNGDVLAARNGSPLLLGQNQTTGEIFLSSDTLSFADQVETVTVIENGQLIEVNSNSSGTGKGHQATVRLSDIETDRELQIVAEPALANREAVTKNGFDHFMIKEIHEAPLAIEKVIEIAQQDERDNHELANLQRVSNLIKTAPHLYTIGSGTAGIAASQTAFYLRQLAGLPATSLVGADAVEYFNLFQAGDVLISPSQSGETADVLEVLELAKSKGVKIITYVNMAGSSMTRLADFSFLAGAGPEIAVMSTKIFESQLAWGYLLAKTVAGDFAVGIADLQQLATQLKKYLADAEVEIELQKWVELLLPAEDIFLMAKFQNFQIIREGMVKLIEGTYKHAHAIPAGDLKHYAITLMEKGVPVIVVLSADETQADVLTAAAQVKARGATILGIGPKLSGAERAEFAGYLEMPTELGADGAVTCSAIANILPLQLLSYYLAVRLGHDPDHPRNIAKSVTVK